MAVLGLHCCTDFSLVVASRGYSVTELHRLLTAEASLVFWASVVVANGLGSCGSWALEHRLGSCVHGLSCSLGCGVFLAGIEPTSLTLAGRWILYQGSPDFLSFVKICTCSGQVISKYVYVI